jgi:hypothetical protein
VTTVDDRRYFFMMRFIDFSAAALSRFAVTTVSGPRTIFSVAIASQVVV